MNVTLGWVSREVVIYVSTCARGNGVSWRILRNTWPRNMPQSKVTMGRRENENLSLLLVMLIPVEFLNLPAGRYKWPIWLFFNIKLICEVFIPGNLFERNNYHLKEYLGMHLPRPWEPEFWLHYLSSSFPALSLQVSIYTEICSRPWLSKAHIRWWWHNS